jgi:type IV pilus assembly protein PilA
MTVTRRHGFTFVEVLIVVGMSCVLAAIGLPRFFQAQKHAKQSEVIANLKTLHAAMSTQAAMPTSIHVPGFDPPRGNRYSYHLSEWCASTEFRSGPEPIRSDADECIGVDTYVHYSLPDFFPVMPIAAVSWDDNALTNGMATSPGVFGTQDNWDYLAYASGDLDMQPFEHPDTWTVASADALIFATCPSTGSMESLPAGEPFRVYNDKDCN